MAEEKATLTIRIKRVGEKGLKALPGILKGIGRAAIAGVAGLVAFGAAAVKLAGAASRFDAVKSSFANLAASQGEDADKMLKKMKELSKGTISDLTLMQQANNALLLGLPVDRFGDMLTIARSAAQATGESMEFMLKSITTGLGRGSKLVLDNLGIVFKLEDAYDEYAKTLGKTSAELTEAEKKQAFINKALETGLKNAKAAGAGQLTLAERVQQVSATFDNLKIVIGQNLGPALEFLLEETSELFTSIETWVKSSSAVDFFKFLTKAISVTKNAFVAFGQIIGTVLAGAGAAVQSAINLNFRQAADQVKETMKEIGQVGINATIETEKELASIDEKFRNADKRRAIDTEQKKQEAILRKKLEGLEAQKVVDDEAALAKREKELEQLELEISFIGMSEEQKSAARLEAKLAANQLEIEQAKTHEKKMAALKERSGLLEQLAKQKRDEKLLQQERSTLGTFATLARSNNKILAAIGKAAAITQIAIKTPQAMADAFAWGTSLGGPGLGAVFKGIAGVAMAAQAAQVAGVPLAQGGIITPSSGGTQATIGEAGRAEAVIPLPEDFDPDEGGVGGGQTIININGPTLGDPSQAREFALMIDEGLLELRRGNESKSFDEGLI